MFLREYVLSWRVHVAGGMAMCKASGFCACVVDVKTDPEERGIMRGCDVLAYCVWTCFLLCIWVVLFAFCVQ